MPQPRSAAGSPGAAAASTSSPQLTAAGKHAEPPGRGSPHTQRQRLQGIASPPNLLLGLRARAGRAEPSPRSHTQKSRGVTPEKLVLPQPPAAERGFRGLSHKWGAQEQAGVSLSLKGGTGAGANLRPDESSGDLGRGATGS